MRDASGEIAGFYIAADLRTLRGRMPAAALPWLNCSAIYNRIRAKKDKTRAK